jgi:HK97 family phage portal protein
VGVLRQAVKATSSPSYIHLGHPDAGYSVPPSQSVIYRSDAEPTGTATGRSVTPETAMTSVPFYAGVRLIAETEGRLPQILYRRVGDDNRERARDKGLYRLLHDEWNPDMSARTGKTTLTGHIVTRGNGFAEMVHDDLGRVAQLWPMRPDRMQVLRDSETGRRFYRYRIESLGDIVDLDASQVFHIPGFGFDGYVGYSIVTLFRESLALGLSTQEFGARFFRSGGQPAAVVTHPAGWDDTRVARFAAKLRGNHAGLSNAQRIAVIEEGVSWETVGMNLDDAQFLETRKYQRSEVPTMLNLPPHMLQDVERSTSWGTGIEEQTLGFVTYNLGSWTDLWDTEVNRQLVRPAYGQTHYAETLVDALLAGRAEDRWKVYQIARDLGVLNAEAIAKRENLPAPTDGSGATYYRPANIVQAIAPNATGDPAAPALADVVDAIGQLIRAGFDPTAVLTALGQRPIPHTGLEPVTVSEQPRSGDPTPAPPAT